MVGLPLKADSVEDFDKETQARLEEEFNKFGDTLQVHHPIYFKLKVNFDFITRTGNKDILCEVTYMLFGPSFQFKFRQFCFKAI